MGTRAEDRRAWGQGTIKDAFHTRGQLPFPIDAKQLHRLVSRQYLSLPRLDHRAIDDKKKFDGLLGTITFCQIT